MPRLKTETMDRLFGFIVLAVTLVSCSKGGFGPSSGFPDDGQPAHGMIVLGKKLENPYKTENISAAIASVYPARDRVEVKPTHLYVRFLPVDQSDFDLISDLDLSDYPLDYEIIKDGDYYHDPQIDDDKVTWQYAVVPHDYVFPDIYYEVIDECFITENDAPERSADGIDWEAVEREAYRLTGNADMLEAAGARGNKVHPSGRITIVDDKVNGGKPFGLAGVRVRCNTFVKYSHAYTDRDGYYTIPKKYSAKVRYRLIYKNEKGFAIGFNKLLVPASTSALGKASPSGLDYTVTKNSGRTMFSRSVVNNAAYDYISRCSADDMGITPPPSDLRIWLFHSLDASSAVMIHHGAFVEGKDIKKFLGVFSSVIAFFSPDITLGTKNLSDYSSIYSAVCHELAHASHFAQVGKGYWDKYIMYIMKSYVASGGMTYGTGSEPDAGYCAVGEMWAYYMESIMYKERYGGNVPSFGSSNWFSPQVFRVLDERGVTRSEILGAMQADVTDVDLLKSRLVSMYPDRGMVINQAFNRYRCGALE